MASFGKMLFPLVSLDVTRESIVESRVRMGGARGIGRPLVGRASFRHNNVQGDRCSRVSGRARGLERDRTRFMSRRRGRSVLTKPVMGQGRWSRFGLATP